jgi:hypothetical protein
MKTNLFRTIFLERGLSVILIALAMAAGCSKENEDAITDALSLTTPTGLEAVTDVANRSATLSWTPVENAESYELNINEAVYTAYKTSLTIPGLEYNTYYAWKVRAKKGDIYSDWSQTQTFATVALRERFTGDWGANDAILTLWIGSGSGNDVWYLDTLLSRYHASGVAVQVAVANNGSGSQVSVSGMDHYITGGETGATAFNIDSQLQNLPLSVNESSGAVSAAKDISSDNVYTKSINKKVKEIPELVVLVDGMDFGEWDEVVKAYIKEYATIETASVTITRVRVTGRLEDAAVTEWDFVYDVELGITHDLDQSMLDMAGISNVNDIIPKPQYMVSTVECEKQ